jgi:hydrogenase maturation protein HypF
VKRVSYDIKGQVQGVGFRPFVYKMAQELDIGGFVKNNESGVEIEVEGSKENLDMFEASLS